MDSCIDEQIAYQALTSQSQAHEKLVNFIVETGVHKVNLKVSSLMCTASLPV